MSADSQKPVTEVKPIAPSHEFEGKSLGHLESTPNTTAIDHALVNKSMGDTSSQITASDSFANEIHKYIRECITLADQKAAFLLRQ